MVKTNFCTLLVFTLYQAQLLHGKMATRGTRLVSTVLTMLFFFHVSLGVVNGSITDCSTVDLSLEHGSYIFPGDDGGNRPATVAVGAVVTACCDNGFYREGPDRITCLEGGQYSEKPTCNDTDECTAPFLYSEGDGPSLYSSFSNPNPVDVNSVAPNSVVGEEQTSCQGRGLLPPNEERCHMDAICTNTVGSFTCVCQDNFIGDGIHCEVDTRPCEDPVVPENGRLVYRSGRRVRYGCLSGYTLYGCSEQICVGGRWVGAVRRQECPPTDCRDYSVKCSEPIAPRHGHVIGGSRVVNSRVYFLCDEGYELVGSSNRVCLGNGRWSGQVPRCQTPRTLTDIASDIQLGLIDRFASYTNSSLERRNLARSANVRSEGLDLVFAFDRSSSINADDFQLAVNFTKELIRSFGVSYAEGGTRVAAVTFATTADIAFSFTPDVDSEEIVFQRLDSLTSGIGGGTALKEGLEAVASLLPNIHHASPQPEAPGNATDVTPAPGNATDAPPVGLMRAGSKHVLFIFTDGRHNTKDPVVLADSLKKNGTYIFAVGVGPQINSTALEKIASPPSISHFFHIRNFDDLQALTTLISKKERDYSQCGQHGAAGNLRTGSALVNEGYVAGEKVWPWLSIIHRDTPTGKEMMCSGALVCERWVLTTASCFDVEQHFFIDGQLYDLSGSLVNMSVTVGEYNVSREEGCEQTIPIQKVIRHDQWQREVQHEFNIALVHLAEPVVLNTCARTTCLPEESDIPRNCHVLGWGTAGSNAPESAVPLQFPLPLVSVPNCHERYTVQGENRETFTVNDNMACVGESSYVARDARCNGDLGSPLACQRDAETWFLHGLGTYGEGCSSYFNRYGVYTKIVPDYVRWISTETGNCTSHHLQKEIVNFNS